MTVSRVSMGSLKTLTIAPWKSEQQLTPTQPPTAISTGSPQVSYTFNKDTMSPTFGGGTTVLSYKPCFAFNVGGQNTTTSAVTLYYQVNKNGTSWKSGNASITNNYYYNLSIYDGNVNDGDVYDVYFWCSATTGMNFTQQNSWVIPSKVQTGAKNLFNAVFTGGQAYNSTNFPLTGTKIGVNWTGSWYAVVAMHTDGTLPQYSLTDNNSTKQLVVPFMQVYSAYGLFYPQIDSGTGNALNNNATQYTGYNCYFPSQIQYRELFFR